ncbi:MAG: cytochrome c [Acidobacteriia bacterium]|nr:cytochrome c [Terriglobia bacterium]
MLKQGFILGLLGAALLLASCDTQLRKSDAELGLNPQQASGRRVFDRYCATCHEAYSAKAWRGPSLEGVFKKQFMPSGTPANDDRVREVITLGRSKMPAFGRVLDQQQLDDLLAYLHTL